MYVLITERDCLDPLQSNGPIIHEIYVAKNATYEACAERAAYLKGRYGKTWIARLSDIEEFTEESSRVAPQQAEGW